MTVVICTYNRAEKLRQTLNGLKNASVPDGVECELIVVDNNFTDNTRAVVAEFEHKPVWKVRYLLEPKKGKSHALNSAIRHAKGEIVSFLDDDVIPAPDWLTRVWQEFSADGDLGVVSGRVELADSQDLPLMVMRDKSRKLAQSYEDLDGRFFGCCAARGAVLADVGHFDTALGPGTQFHSAEDLDYNYRTWRAGWKMLYAPSLVVFHNHGRRTPESAVTLSRAYMIGLGAFRGKHVFLGDIFMAKSMYWWACARARQFMRGENIIRNCRVTTWVMIGFLGYLGYQLLGTIRRSRKSAIQDSLRNMPTQDTLTLDGHDRPGWRQ
jgi:glycosyltransferase involved in cell wall biosynthesis